MKRRARNQFIIRAPPATVSHGDDVFFIFIFNFYYFVNVAFYCYYTTRRTHARRPSFSRLKYNKIYTTIVATATPINILYDVSCIPSFYMCVCVYYIVYLCIIFGSIARAFTVLSVFI